LELGTNVQYALILTIVKPVKLAMTILIPSLRLRSQSKLLTNKAAQALNNLLNGKVVVGVLLLDHPLKAQVDMDALLSDHTLKVHMDTMKVHMDIMKVHMDIMALNHPLKVQVHMDIMVPNHPLKVKAHMDAMASDHLGVEEDKVEENGEISARTGTNLKILIPLAI
jgi:hypothetical protein